MQCKPPHFQFLRWTCPGLEVAEMRESTTMQDGAEPLMSVVYPEAAAAISGSGRLPNEPSSGRGSGIFLPVEINPMISAA